ncbi:MAG TPA: hypothetical protein VL426_00570 [Candidatus Binatia bacterium]|nr:hypothetical protein [Candidatus Binatia bacterium]
MEKKPRTPSRRATGPRAKRSAAGPRRVAALRKKKVAVATPAVEAAQLPPQPPAAPVRLAAPDARPARMATRLPWRMLAAFFAFAIVVTAVGGFIISAVNAATFQGPSQAAPGGNIPLTIWNREAAAATQTTAAVAIDGGTLTVGIPDLFYGNMAAGSPATSNGIRLQTAAADRFKVTRDGNMTATGMTTLGTAALVVGGAQNLVYGNVDTTSTGSLLLFQNESLDRFRVDVQGRVSAGSADAVMAGAQNLIYGNIDTTSTGSLMLLQTESADRFRVNARGDVKGAGCFGKSLIGLTASSFQPGAILSYIGADNKCNDIANGASFLGSHVCKVDEILESIQCGQAGDPIRTLGGNNAWINGGPPGINTANANDCIGWTSAAPTSFGRVWVFDNTTGGFGTLTGCNIGSPGLKIACCK